MAYALTFNGIVDIIHEAGGFSGSLSCAEAAKNLKLYEDFTCRLMHAGAAVRILAASADLPTEYTLTSAGGRLVHFANVVHILQS